MLIQQGHLFGDSPGQPPANHAESGSLTLTIRPVRPLTKAQKTFNRLVAKVEALRVKLEQESRNLDAALRYYGEELHPRLQRRLAIRKEVVRAMAPYLESKHLKGRGDRRTIREVLASQMDAVVHEGGPLTEIDLQQIFQKIYRVSWGEAQRKRVEEMRSEMEGMLDDFGIDLDLSGLRPDMTEAEFAAETARLQHGFEQQREDNEFQEQERPKSKRQIKSEQRSRQTQEAQKRSVATIYKQLARALHPDLESDPAQRERKSGLMQELTTAYRGNDLHTLLRLELQWIDGEKGNLERMTDEKLAIYNVVLKEQIAELELEIEQLPYKPRYQQLLVPVGPFGIGVRAGDESEALRLDAMIKDMEAMLDDLRSENVAVIRQILENWRRSGRAQHRMEQMMAGMRF